MEYSPPPRGLIVDMITPLKNGTLDGPGLERLIERVLPHAEALLLAGPRHGEGADMAPALRLELVKKTLEIVDRDGVPIFVWVTAHTEIQTRENIGAFQRYRENRRSPGGLFWVDTPLIYHSNRGLPEYYRALLAPENVPLLLHNDPDCINTTKTFKRHNIRTAVLKELAQIEGISGLIFSGSLERAHHYQRACRSRQGFRIYDGDEKRFLEYPSMGGVISVGANLSPGPWKKITHSSIGLQAHRENYPDRLQQIWETGECLKKMVSIYASSPTAAVKRVLSDMGIIETPEMIAPVEIGDETVESLKALMADLGEPI